MSSPSFGLQSDTVPGSKAPLKIATGDSYFPFATTDLADGGWSRAIVQAVFEQLKMPVKIDVLPWSRGYQWALSGQYDGTFPYVHSKERDELFYYSLPINYVPTRVYVRADMQIDGVDSLRQKTLCLPYGYTMDLWTEHYFSTFDLTINRAKDSAGCAGHIMKKWSDFGFINGYFNSEQLKKRFGALDNIKVLDKQIGLIPLHFIVSKNTPNAQQLIERFNAGLKALMENGQKQKIDSRYQASMLNFTSQMD